MVEKKARRTPKRSRRATSRNTTGKAKLGKALRRSCVPAARSVRDRGILYENQKALVI
jgi:hypothetical protein